MTRRPSLSRIVLNDYIAFLAFAFPIVLWVFQIALFVFRPENAVGFIAIVAVLTILGWLFLVWRIRIFYSAFENALECQATISNLSFFRDRGRVDYVYTHQGHKYISGNAIMKNQRTQALSVGQEVILIVDRNNPKRAFIRELYS